MKMKKTGGTILAATLLLSALMAACGDSEPARIITPMLKTRDKAVWTAARANLDAIRTGLGAYAAGAGDNLYPAGPLGYAQLAALIPGAGLPPTHMEAKFSEFIYESSPDRSGYRIAVRTIDREGDVLTATPSGVDPSRYPY
jgi:hypothetical protein